MASKILYQWHPHEDAVIVNGITEGWLWSRIAEALPGRSSRTARLRAQRLGILPCRKTKDEMPCPIGASRKLRAAIDGQVAKHASKWGVGIADARTLLMNATAL
jgi:hypothetical protein